MTKTHRGVGIVMFALLSAPMVAHFLPIFRVRSPYQGRFRISGPVIPRAQWPFRELELHAAFSEAFPGSTPEHDEYASFFVDTQPFLGTEEIDRLECAGDSVFVVLRDHAAIDFKARTAHLLANSGRIAVYVDGKLNAAPLVRGVIRGGRFQVLHVPCTTASAGAARAN